MDALENSPDFCRMLIDYILSEKRNICLRFFNYDNLQHLANIFYNISINIDSPQNKNYELNFAIIFLSERTYFLDEITKNKFFLCAILSKNKLYKRKTYWMDLINLKLSKRTKDHVRKISSKIL
jgi:hypothetical protein